MALALASPERANVDHTTFRKQLCCIVGAATGIVAYRQVPVVRTEVSGRDTRGSGCLISGAPLVGSASINFISSIRFNRRSSKAAKSLSETCAVTASFGLSKGNTAIAALILV